MSELSSLYCKVKITKTQLDHFLNSTPEKPQLNQNWIDWWESRKMYSKMELTQDVLRSYNDNSNKKILDDWMKYPQAMAFSDYEESSEEWDFGMLFFSENFVEMIPMFAFIVSLENYIVESTENGAIVFPFFWGDDDVSAYIYFENGKAILSPKVQILEDVNSDFLEKANNFLNQKWEEMSKNMDLD